MKKSGRPLIIPIFIPNAGCPNRCVFCNEKITAGKGPGLPDEKTFRDDIESYLARSSPDRPAEIAFYGGTFTALNSDDQKRLLEFASPYLRSGIVQAIRISTRPDRIETENILFLKGRGVRTVEIGAQSLVDRVLLETKRGHSAEDVCRAVSIVSDAGLNAGVHLMAGLPGENKHDFMTSVRKTISLAPAMVRIHPTIVFKDTILAQWYNESRYRPISLDEAVEWCAEALTAFECAGIPVIRIGLQPTADFDAPGNIAAGPFHPAFRTLVAGFLFHDRATALLSRLSSRTNKAVFAVNSSRLSDFKGINGRNMKIIQRNFDQLELSVETDDAMNSSAVFLKAEDKIFKTDLKEFAPGRTEQ
ncbi:MAG: radical SAM protein [Deltaproteobacteria bacterium]|nr:radical SAM protein [Deltaproteobacteria bacterium]